MNITSQLVFNVAILFLMMIPGIVMKKCKLCSPDFGKGISNLVLYIAQPALILFAYLDYEEGGIWMNALYVFSFSIITHVIFTAVALLLFRGAPDGRRGMLRFATIFSNAAFMGIPLISSILGAEATIYASIYNITFNAFLWSLGVYLCSVDKEPTEEDFNENGKRKNPISVKKVLLHPVTLASVVGIMMLALGINSYVPALIMDGLEMLKNLVAPLSMVVIGLRIADMDFHGIVKDRHMYVFLGMRHFVLPLAVLLVMRLIALTGLPINDIITTTVLIMAAAPSATSSTMFAEKYDCDAVYVSRIVAISSILSVITMPIVVMISNFI